jgi:hypothetical protein
MNRKVIAQKIAPAVLVGAFLVTAAANKPGQTATKADVKKAELVDAYVYGYPLVTMEMTRRVITNVEKPEGTHAPMGQLVRMRSYPTAAFKDVTAPNADTLYTSAFFDVSQEPWVLSVPEAHGRYYLMPMLDGWTDVFKVPGTRTTGTGPQVYLITGPRWKGTGPSGMTAYESPTAIVWLIGRIYCTGTAEDYAAVHKMQDEISLAPLSAYGKPYTAALGKVDPSIDMKTPVRTQVNRLSTDAYFTLLAKLLKDNPPAAIDAPMVAKLADVGIVAGKPFDSTKLGVDAASLESVPALGVQKIMGWAQGSVAAGVNKDIHGWLFSTQTGLYGTNYVQRAFVTAVGLGANRPQDAVYPTSQADAAGKPYIGTERYVMHFDKGQFPPVNGFWSLTMYDAQFFFVDNPLNRYTLSQRNKFRENADGSVDLYLQHDNPGRGKEANWLPAPQGRFMLMLRLYWPKETPPSLLDGTWTIPSVVRQTEPVVQ